MTMLHLLFMLISLLVYVFSTRACGERRAPAAAIGWVIGLLTLPYFVLPLYLMFGTRKLPRIRRVAHAPPQPRHWASDLLAALGIDPPDEAQVHFHTDGAAALDALWSVIDGARHRLDIVTFLIGDDEVGQALVARVAARVQAGVSVRVLVDGVGLWLKARRMQDQLLRAGADARLFHPVFRLKLQASRNLRNHRKSVIADSERLWAGGRNLASEYFQGNAADPAWLDLSFDLRGAPVAAACTQFEQDWADTEPDWRATHQRAQPSACIAQSTTANAKDIKQTSGPAARAQFVPSGPDQLDDTLYSVLLAGIHRAERDILIATPYFIPDDGLKTALRLAALRGVRITLVIPQCSNHRLADLARSRSLRELASLGVQVRGVTRMLHAKVMVIDNSLAICGSANFDVRSLLLNYEASLLFYSAPEILWLRQWIDAVAIAAPPHEIKPAGFFRDIGEGLLLAIAFEL